MAPIEPKRRVKSIKKPGDNPMAKIRKPKVKKPYSRAYMFKLLKKVLKRQANAYDSVQQIYKTYLRIIKMVCDVVVRRNRSLTFKEARKVVAKMIPREMAMAAIREFRQQSFGVKVAIITVRKVSPADE